MQPADLVRYGLFAGIAATANANRRHYHMATTWLPHLAVNTVALLLPDLLRVVLPAQKRQAEPAGVLALGTKTLQALVCDNAAYVAYVAPLALGYLLSHPEFNIYKGEWGNMELAGFGFDAIPHSAAGFALSAAVIDTLVEATKHVAASSPLAPVLQHMEHQREWVALAALALVTCAWESSEYRVYKHELAQRGSIEDINMQWSMRDTLADCAANVFGWAAAVAWRKRSTVNRI